MGNLNKVVYTDHQTVITADNLNAIQDSVIQNTSYTTCTTAANTAAKTAALTNFVLTTGSAVKVKFTNTNTAANPTLNVNSTGAKPIMQYGTTACGADENTSWSDGAVVEFVYDGTNWVMQGKTIAEAGTFRKDVVINDEGATTSSEVSLLTLGNSTATGTVGNSNGMIRMYGQNDKYLQIRPLPASGAFTTANRTIWFPDNDGTVMLNAGGTFTGNITVNRSDGTASAQGYSSVTAGNSTAVGTAGNSRGQILLYGTGTNHTTIRASSSADRTITFPDTTGTPAIYTKDANNFATIKEGNTNINPVIPYLGIGARKDNLWNNSDSVLLLAEKFNGGTFRISANSDSYPAGLPTVLQGTTAILYRQQFMQYESTLNHAIVILYEIYPVGRRIWVNHYNTSWGGWKAIDTQCQNFSGIKLDAIKQTLTPSVGSAYTLYGGLYYYKIGTKVHVNVGLQGLTKTDYTANLVGTLPTGYRPSHQISNVCAGGSGNTYAQVCVNSAGQINVYTNQQYVNGQIEFDVF